MHGFQRYDFFSFLTLLNKDSLANKVSYLQYYGKLSPYKANSSCPNLKKFYFQVKSTFLGGHFEDQDKIFDREGIHGQKSWNLRNLRKYFLRLVKSWKKYRKETFCISWKVFSKLEKTFQDFKVKNFLNFQDFLSGLWHLKNFQDFLYRKTFCTESPESSERFL